MTTRLDLEWYPGTGVKLSAAEVASAKASLNWKGGQRKEYKRKLYAALGKMAAAKVLPFRPAAMTVQTRNRWFTSFIVPRRMSEVAVLVWPRRSSKAPDWHPDTKELLLPGEWTVVGCGLNACVRRASCMQTYNDAEYSVVDWEWFAWAPYEDTFNQKQRIGLVAPDSYFEERTRQLLCESGSSFPEKASAPS